MHNANWKRLRQFLILGNEACVYRAGEAQFNFDQTPSLNACLAEDGCRVVAMIEDVARARRAPRSEPLLYALATAASPKHAAAGVNSAALAAMPGVVQSGSDLCSFVSFARKGRGWGRGLRSAIARWYLDQPLGELACDILRTREQSGWAHRDLLRMAHPKPKSALQNALFQWAVEGELGHLAPPNIAATELRPVYAFERAREATDEREVVQLIEHYRMTDETVPAEWKKSAAVWEGLLDYMPYPAVLRNLETMAGAGLFKTESPATALAVARLMDRRRIQESRMSPVAIALKRISYCGRPDASPVLIDALLTAEKIAMDQTPADAAPVYVVEGEQGTELSKVLAAEFRKMFRKAGAEAQLWIVLNETAVPEGKRAAVILEQAGVEGTTPPGCLVVHGIDASVPGVVADFLRTG